MTKETTTNAPQAEPTHSQIDRRSIPPMARESTWKLADGPAVRRIDWPGVAEQGKPPRGSILFLPGRGDAYEKYLESLEEWHRDGWRVTASDWRGQAGSGRLGKDPFTGHIEDFSIWTDDLAHLWKAWVKQVPGPHIIAGHSMGGHLIMRALVDGKLDGDTPPDACFLSAPMLGMQGPPVPLIVQHLVAKLMTWIGDPTRQAWKWSEKPGELPPNRANLLTHDPVRYADEQYWRDTRPELVMGPASWRWVERGFASSRVLERAGALERVTLPVLIVSTTDDKLVSHEANVRAAKRLPNGRLFELGEEAHHEVLRETDTVRRRVMDAIAAFLDEVAPRRAPAAP
ncbi:alpha/beta hydrolase [Erythrobacter sp. SCSIO 43205]|uniref:alpha/beta fold hydrolase n=1 Tax=Erythrobacter sp. SCSIO 43205 TaxID=2779361 RepID=UPI001CA7D16E|nr:alpha/beta hydrolase [Erythrobacter sp. SCSIO 43205]UAB79121.1 alpha/beta hydrolase [Erythrobacter sp. SCSIO 43205]